ncbi:hypothetical protein [Corynebacterium jeikeium]|uniref:hypothetical protein n=1 Tax=Corynebacterium jeikeium TaxID=38289 RepID=UPI000556A32C|nr:hypothetical protein [Corynebacterium jeikeium]
MTTYTDRHEAIHHETITALGDYADEHDIDAIADQVLTTTGEGSDYRYMLDEDVDFWAVVEANAL